jgi:branched-chain amino acid transport system permease protein
MTSDVLILFLEQGVLSGLVSGSVYALLALAIVMIFKTSEVPNFAQGDVFMAAAYLAFYLIVVRLLPIWAVIPLTLVLCFIGMAVFQAVVLRRVETSRGAAVNMVIATLGLSYLLKGVVTYSGLGDTPRSFPSLVPQDPVMIGEAMVTQLDLAILAVSIVIMLLLFGLFGFTRTGRAMRAVGMNRRAAALVGIDLQRTHALVWGIAGLISAIAAILISPKILMTADMGQIVILAFAAAIIGGFTSLPGAVIGGFVIGIVENMVALFISSQAIDVAPFVAIMLVLIVRPQGLLGGKAQRKKV